MRLAAGEAAFGALLAALCEEERTRASRYQFEIHRQRYVLARGLLRAILGRYAGLDPREVRFTYGTYGKPALAGGPVHFNLSHSEDLVLYALTREAEIGVDVERIRAIEDAEGIARRFFSAEECAQLSRVSPEEAAAAFFHCWTRKEAYVKALGGGLSVPLDGFQVSLLPGEACRLLAIDGNPSEWSLLDLSDVLEPAGNYAGALAVHATGMRLKTRRCRSAEECLEALGE